MGRVKDGKSRVFVYYSWIVCCAAIISPFMYSLVTGWDALVRTVIVFLKCPGSLPLPSYVTSICPSSPGRMGTRVNVGIVHPHEANAWLMMRGASPVFLNLKVH